MFSALFLHWQFRPDVVALLAVFAAAYTVGWLRLRRRAGSEAGRRRMARRLAAYWGGIGALALALLSGVNTLGEQLFWMHMIQHLLLVMVAVPLLWLGNPFPFVLWGLPYGRKVGGMLFARNSLFRRALAALSRPGVAWFLFAANLWGWHDPQLYSAAQGREWAHYLQHLLFFATAMLLWWNVIGAAPHLRGSPPLLLRCALLVGAAVANMIPGVLIAMADQPLYSYYVGLGGSWGFSALDDQRLAGLIMWIPGTMMYLLGVLAVIAALGRKQAGFVSPASAALPAHPHVARASPCSPRIPM